ncbi:hypothetical protein [Paenibacillus sp. FSL L8-0708]|uniref:hypothetical protein n=1 Tax=Paenibacillus sp. FSL L8-0708 TaxID=2975311 RepID=UPI0030FA7AAB
MAKYDYEIAGELTQELIKARGVALSTSQSAAAQVSAVAKEILTAEEVALAYRTILVAVREGINS